VHNHFYAEQLLARLLSLRRDHLAQRVERVSATRGDGLGYDILSFESSGADRLIEVKTTAYGQDTRFFVSRNELAFSREQDAAFHLYRVFAFRKSPKLYMRQDALDRGFALDPETYKARTA
jgi:hypothetical protein